MPTAEAKINGSSTMTFREKAKRSQSPHEVDDVRIQKIGPLLPPACLMEELPLTGGVRETVLEGRKSIESILTGEDDRLVCVVGPCSIHDAALGKEYALQLRKLRNSLKDDLNIVMRVYFEKPRTTVGWKGLINDPNLDGSFQVNKGLKLARKLLLDINEIGVPCGCEFLDTISPQFTADLVSWGAIGARTTESQCHRELASGLSMPVGFKNGTSGDIQVAVDALRSAKSPHAFLSVTKQGLAAIVHTNGNPHCHVILRGGKDGPNYDAKSIEKTKGIMDKAGIECRVIVDCSHANSFKKHSNQPKVLADIGAQIAAGGNEIVGIMIESNINEGNQKLKPGVTLPSSLKYGVSVTDACVNIAQTKQMLEGLAAAVRARRKLRAVNESKFKESSE